MTAKEWLEKNARVAVTGAKYDRAYETHVGERISQRSAGTPSDVNATVRKIKALLAGVGDGKSHLPATHQDLTYNAHLAIPGHGQLVFNPAGEGRPAQMVSFLEEGMTPYAGSRPLEEVYPGQVRPVRREIKRLLDALPQRVVRK
jgi:hypothetical protein